MLIKKKKKKQYEIWQIAKGSKFEQMLFGDKKTWDKHKLIPSADGYEKVYEGIIDASCVDDKKILEILFRLFNINCPRETSDKNITYC